jgi:hypothetical protein
VTGASSLNVNRLRRFSDNDQRTRNKRNATLSYTEGTTADASGGVEEPAWTKYYGFDSYKQRKAYQENPNKSKCFISVICASCERRHVSFQKN